MRGYSLRTGVFRPENSPQWNFLGLVARAAPLRLPAERPNAPIANYQIGGEQRTD